MAAISRPCHVERSRVVTVGTHAGSSRLALFTVIADHGGHGITKDPAPSGLRRQIRLEETLLSLMSLVSLADPVWGGGGGIGDELYLRSLRSVYLPDWT